MSYEEFLQKLRETPRDWKLTASGAIRRTGVFGIPVQCPALEINIFDLETGGEMWYKRRDITLAADRDKKHDPQIRADLLAACGLTEVKTDGGGQ